MAKQSNQLEQSLDLTNFFINRIYSISPGSVTEIDRAAHHSLYLVKTALSGNLVNGECLPLLEGEVPIYSERTVSWWPFLGVEYYLNIPSSGDDNVHKIKRRFFSAVQPSFDVTEHIKNYPADQIPAGLKKDEQNRRYNFRFREDIQKHIQES